MPKVAPLQSSFITGEVSPLFYGRPDVPRYKQGMAESLNYLSTLQGPIVRRPGTKSVNNVKTQAKPPVLIPFKFSSSQNYMLEFGEGYIRFYINNARILLSQNTYSVSGSYLSQNATATIPGQSFYGLRADLNPLQNELIQSSALINSGEIMELTNPYLYADDLTQIKFIQTGDTLYLFHPLYPVYKLQRYASNYWTIRTVYFQDGPYLPLNSYNTIGDSTNVQLVTFTVGPAGALLITDPTYVVDDAITDPGGSGQIVIEFAAAHNFISGQNVYVQSIVGTTEANNYDPLLNGSTDVTYWKIRVLSATRILLLGSTFTNAYVSGGTVQPALFPFTKSGMSISQYDGGRRISLTFSDGSRRWATIQLTSNTASAQVIMGPEQVFPASQTTVGWNLGIYRLANAILGTPVQYPSCGCFHQNRLVLAGVANYPQQIDGSEVGLFESFGPNSQEDIQITDANAFQFELASKELNIIRWLASSAQGLLAGSGACEWVITPSGQSAALSPTNINAMQSSSFGSANVDAAQLGNAALSIQKGSRKVREMNFFFQVGTFRSSDLTEISEHITLPTITKLVVMRDPQPILWAIRSDGNLISMTYDRGDESLRAGWNRHQLGGRSDSGGTNPIVTSIAVIPDPTGVFDQLWMVVKRYVNGQTVYGIEYMTEIWNASIDQEDAFQYDYGITFDNPKAITVFTTAAQAVVTAVGHGFSNDDIIRIDDVTGLNKTVTDINDNETIENLVNTKKFTVSDVTTDTFKLKDFSGNYISSVDYSAYISGGYARKLVSTITGLTYLANETVSLLADGAPHPDAVVSNSGVLTLNYPAAKVQIGYSYNSDGKLLRIDAGAADGTSIGKIRRTVRAAFQIYRTGDLAVGTNFNRLTPVLLSRADELKADEAPNLYSGIVREGLESKYDFDSQICFRQNSGYPGTINSITIFMEEFDV